jgi:biopolymer transport protein ExbD
MAGTGKSGGADINVVPLIDIVLVLLIIFMVITPLIVKQMDLNLPDVEVDVTPPPPEDPPKEQIVLVMGADLQTYVNKEPIPREQLEQRLKNVFQGRAYEDKVLFFDAEDAANYGETVRVLDIARGAGVVKVGLITDRTNMAPPGQPVPGATPVDPNAPAAPPATPAP